jgi:hypothetical protein
VPKPSQPDNVIFVFGSNLAGRHGRGSALAAKQHFGALDGVGVGRMGMCYAIPTKDRYLRVLPLTTIQGHVKDFLDYARQHTEFDFMVVAIGCGLAGYQPADIAPMFRHAPTNVKLPQPFRDVLFGGE